VIDVGTLEKAMPSRPLGDERPYIVWAGEAHGVAIIHVSYDLDAEFWVSPIWTMSQKGVALVDKAGHMVKNERRDR
jgi:hypothetical protein